MPTQIDGSTGVSKVQDWVIVQADLGSNVVGNRPTYGAAANPYNTQIKHESAVLVRAA